MLLNLVNHLHSNIFILIQEVKKQEKFIESYLHSNIFILIPLICLVDIKPNKNLHSNIFILIQKMFWCSKGE